MKILVAVKRVIDYNVQVRVKEDGTGVVTDNVKMSTNPPDDNAVEEAVKIKESGKAKEIVAVTVGEEKAQEKKILEKMLKYPGKVFSRNDIGKIINISKERTIDVMITRLRQKIESDPKNPKYLQTIRGSGYVLWIK